MTTKAIRNGILKDWGELLDTEPLKPRKTRNIRGGIRLNTSGPQKAISAAAMHQKLIKAVRKVPEVMVKISGGGKNMQRIKAHIDYISRNGDVELENETGDIYKGKDELKDIRDAWAKGRVGLPEEGERRREAFNIIFSMPPGTDRDSVKDAVRAFAKQQFNHHQYVFASHEDEEHPHVHLCVKAADQSGVRLNPRKNDLQQWRELFVEKLHDVGIEANATPRWVRGVVQKHEKQAIKHINREHKQGKRKEPARVTQKHYQEAVAALERNHTRINPAQEKIRSRRKLAHQLYGSLARGLLKGGRDDKTLALEVTQFVRTMPSTATRHEDLVKRLSESQQRTVTREHALSKEPVFKDQGPERS